jgi:large subunit ribosomal protein L24
MAALLSSRMQSSFLGSSVQSRSFTARRPAAASVVVRAAYGNRPNVGGGRKWIHTKVNDNGKPVKVPMHVKKGDLVVVSTAGTLVVVKGLRRIPF